MILNVIGSSPAWPNPGQPQAGYLLSQSEPDSRLLLDCGPGVLSHLRGGRHLPVGGVVISHLHLDHWGDLVPWCWFAASRPEEHGTDPQLWLPPGGHERLCEFGRVFAREDMLDLAFTVGEYRPNEPFSTAGFTIEARKVIHFGHDAFGLRVTDRDGAVVAYSGDSGPGRQLADLFRDADLAICEATLGAASDDGVPRGHLTTAEAVQATHGTRQLLLTHRPYDLPDPGGMDVAYPGLELRFERP